MSTNVITIGPNGVTGDQKFILELNEALNTRSAAFVAVAFLFQYTYAVTLWVLRRRRGDIKPEVSQTVARQVFYISKPGDGVFAIHEFGQRVNAVVNTLNFMALLFPQLLIVILYIFGIILAWAEGWDAPTGPNFFGYCMSFWPVSMAPDNAIKSELGKFIGLTLSLYLFVVINTIMGLAGSMRSVTMLLSILPVGFLGFLLLVLFATPAVISLFALLTGIPTALDMGVSLREGFLTSMDWITTGGNLGLGPPQAELTYDCLAVQYIMGSLWTVSFSGFLLGVIGGHPICLNFMSICQGDSPWVIDEKENAKEAQVQESETPQVDNDIVGRWGYNNGVHCYNIRGSQQNCIFEDTVGGGNVTGNLVLQGDWLLAPLVHEDGRVEGNIRLRLVQVEGVSQVHSQFQRPGAGPEAWGPVIAATRMDGGAGQVVPQEIGQRSSISSSQSFLLDPSPDERRIDPILEGRAVTFDEMCLAHENDMLTSIQLRQHWQHLSLAPRSRLEWEDKQRHVEVLQAEIAKTQEDLVKLQSQPLVDPDEEAKVRAAEDSVLMLRERIKTETGTEGKPPSTPITQQQQPEIAEEEQVRTPQQPDEEEQRLTAQCKELEAQVDKANQALKDCDTELQGLQSKLQATERNMDATMQEYKVVEAELGRWQTLGESAMLTTPPTSRSPEFAQFQKDPEGRSCARMCAF
jgi:hypothetical protein